MLIAILGAGLVHWPTHLRRAGTFNYEELLNTPIPRRGIFADAGLLHRLRGENAGGAAAWLAAGCAPRAPTAGLADLAGILLKTAAYGSAAFLLAILFPNVCRREFAPIAMWLGVIGIFLRRVDGLTQYDTAARLLIPLRFPTWASVLTLSTPAANWLAFTGG